MASHIGLQDISQIRARIKQVVKHSNRVSQIALNAMFMSRRTNDGVSGFASVTTQLRTFSTELNKAIAELNGHLSQLVGTVAGLSRTQRFESLAMKVYHIPAAHTLKHNINQQVDELNRELEDTVEDLLREFKRLLLLVGMGQNLAVLAKIEASGIGQLSKALSDIADDMSDTINAIEDCVKFSQIQIAA